MWAPSFTIGFFALLAAAPRKRTLFLFLDLHQKSFSYYNVSFHLKHTRSTGKNSPFDHFTVLKSHFVVFFYLYVVILVQFK